MRIVILGSNGMLGQSLKRIFDGCGRCDVVTFARSDADVCMDFADRERLHLELKQHKPDVVINAAAIIDLKFCEQYAEKAHEINAGMPGFVADVCSSLGAYFIHISTDHYYANDGKKLHSEVAPVVLLNEYAKSKYAGEKNTLLNDTALVVRTNIVGFRNNVSRPTFLEWAIAKIEQKKQMILFDDFFTSSLFVDELSKILVDILELKPHGIFNIASATVASKEEFVLALSRSLFASVPDYDVAHVNDTLDIRRATSLGLDVTKVETILGYAMPALDEVIYDIKKAYKGV